MDLSTRHPAAAAEPWPGPRQLADAVIQALSAPRLSLDAVRDAVVRYARGARDRAIAADEMMAGLAPRVRRCLDGVPGERRDELLAHVSWWAAHGYHGAD